MSKCDICNKPVKEDKEGNKRYCQGHSQAEVKQWCKDHPNWINKILSEGK